MKNSHFEGTNTANRPKCNLIWEIMHQGHNSLNASHCVVSLTQYHTFLGVLYSSTEINGAIELHLAACCTQVLERGMRSGGNGGIKPVSCSYTDASPRNDARGWLQQPVICLTTGSLLGLGASSR